MISLETIGLVSAIENLGDMKDNLGGNPKAITTPTVSYGVFPEFGLGQPAQPYMRPSAREAQAKVNELISGTNDLGEAVMEVAYYIERRSKKRCPVDSGTLRASIQTRRIR